MDFYTSVNKGRIGKKVGDNINKHLSKFEGKRVLITVDKVKSKRSTQQNRLWWLYMTILSDHTGYTKQEIHEICKFKFLKREKVIEETGEIMEYLESTAALNKSEFSDLVSDMTRWASETFSVVLPQPNDNFELNFDRE